MPAKYFQPKFSTE